MDTLTPRAGNTARRASNACRDSVAGVAADGEKLSINTGRRRKRTLQKRVAKVKRSPCRRDLWASNRRPQGQTAVFRGTNPSEWPPRHGTYERRKEIGRPRITLRAVVLE